LSQKLPSKQKIIALPLPQPLNSPPSPAATYRPESTPFAQSLHYEPVDHPPPSAPLSGLATAQKEDVERFVVVPRRQRRQAPRLPFACIIEVDGRRGGEMVASPSPRSSRRKGDDVGERGGQGGNDDNGARGGRVDSSSSCLVRRWSTEKNREREARQH
jgi:hypothetical protein